MGFPPVSTSTSWWQALLNLGTTLIKDYIGLVTGVWQDIKNLVNEGIQWITGLWNDIVATVMGPLIATVKNIVNMVLQQIVNTVIAPILNGQSTSLSTLFGNVSVDTIASYGPSVFANITTALNSESSLLGNVGSIMGSMMSSLSVFSGAGTILGPLISMAGPGIMVTVVSMIASVVMNTVLTPLFSQFTSTVLSNDLDTLMAPLGGTSTGALAILDNIAALTSVTSQPGVTSQDSGSGYISQSTGSSVGTTSTSNPLSSTGSSGTCDKTAIGTCLASEFNDTLLLSQTLLDNSNGAFSVFNNVMGELFTAMETLTGSSSTPATSTAAPAKAISTSATSSAIATSATSSATTMSASDYAFFLGLTAVEKDLLGIIKISTTYDGADPVLPFVIQFIRTTMEADQYMLSIEYNHDYPSISSELWVFKSLISYSTNFVSLLDDNNNMAPQSWASSFSNTFGMSNFDQASQLIKTVLQGAGAVVFILYYLEHESSISLKTFGFMGAYVVQRVLKMFLFGVLKFSESESYNTERFLFAISIGLNIVQMIWS